MNNTPSNNHGQDALLFASFISNLGMDGRDSVLAAKMHQRKMDARSFVDPHSLDVYGRPRVLTGWEAILYSLARATVIGVAIGFALAISMVAIHTSLSLKTQSGSDRLQVAAREASS